MAVIINGDTGIDKITDGSIVTADFASTVPLGTKNLIINGDMRIAQRGTSVTGVTSVSHGIADQFFNSISSLGTWDLTQESDGPSGFGKSIKFDCTTEDASPSASDFIILQHRMEAQNVSLLDYGSSDAKTFTLSFYVKSNKTGSGSIEFMQSDNSDKHYTTSYTISSANTWERKIITVAGDTSGVINDDNGRGFEIIWWLNSGSTFTSGSLSNAWQAQDNADRNADNLGVGGAVTDYWQITGVQLEIGDTATPFEHRPYDMELQRCMRYFETGTARQYGSSDGSLNIVHEETFKVQKRATPTMTNTTWTYARNGGSGSISPVNYQTDINQHSRYGNIGAAWVVGYFAGTWTASSEL